MANNRMWLKCECGEHFALAKYYPTISDGWYTPYRFGLFDDIEAMDAADCAMAAADWFAKYQTWLAAHSHDHERRMYCPAFTLEYEEPEEMV
jgi:hypothetical protein